MASEVLPLLKGDKENLDLYHSTYHLKISPTSATRYKPTSTVTMYIILGQLPPPVTLARNILTLYVNLVRDPDSIECQIIRRQLAMKNNSSKSWVVTVKGVKDLLLEYGLPSAYMYELFVNPPSKWRCKITLRRHKLSERLLTGSVKRLARK